MSANDSDDAIWAKVQAIARKHDHGQPVTREEVETLLIALVEAKQSIDYLTRELTRRDEHTSKVSTSQYIDLVPHNKHSKNR